MTKKNEETLQNILLIQYVFGLKYRTLHGNILYWMLNNQSEHDVRTAKTYTLSQLSLRNGQDKEEIWVAFRGKIYDVSESRLWRKGKHYEHWAGQDLTNELQDAPHTEKVFEKFKVIGLLKNN